MLISADAEGVNTLKSGLEGGLFDVGKGVCLQYIYTYLSVTKQKRQDISYEYHINRSIIKTTVHCDHVAMQDNAPLASSNPLKAKQIMSYTDHINAGPLPLPRPPPPSSRKPL